MQCLILFIKREPVLVICTVLALVSLCFVPPDRAYVDYLDFRTLALLLTLMLIVAGLQAQGALPGSAVH